MTLFVKIVEKIAKCYCYAEAYVRYTGSNIVHRDRYAPPNSARFLRTKIFPLRSLKNLKNIVVGLNWVGLKLITNIFTRTFNYIRTQWRSFDATTLERLLNGFFLDFSVIIPDFVKPISCISSLYLFPFCSG